MEFNYLVIANVGQVAVTPARSRSATPTYITCHAVAIAWGDWYDKSPFDGMRDIRFLSYGGMEVASVRIAHTGRPADAVPINIGEVGYVQFKPVYGKKVKLSADFEFAPDTSWCELFVKNLKIRISKCDPERPLRFIDYKGPTAPFGPLVEDWISPYISWPNRPFVEWRLNPTRTTEPFLRIR